MPKVLFSLLVFLTPLLFWTLTPNFFTTPKHLLLITGTISLFLTWAVKTYTSSTLTTSASPLRFGLLAFALVIIINLVINSTNRVESLVGPASVYLLLTVFSYFLTISAHLNLRLPLIISFIGSTTVLAIHTLLQLTIFYRLDTLPVFMQSRAFTLTGSPLTSWILLILGGSISLYLTLKHHRLTIWLSLATILHIVAVVALSILLLPQEELALNLLPLSASWKIALDAMKSARSFFFGIGLTQFPNFFKSVKPLSLNATPFWNSLPTTSSSEVLQLLTTTGLLGFLSFLSLPLLAFKNHSHDHLSTSFKILGLLSGFALIFTPGSIPLLLVFFLALGVLAYEAPSTSTLTQPARIILPLTIIALVTYLSYSTYLVVVAEFNIRQAQQALSRNDGKQVYDHHLTAIRSLPQMTGYHLSYSQVNLSLASALSQKKDELTESDRQNISGLISQAIKEGKLATNLSPNNSLAWQNLGNIYKNLINVAGGVEQFALESYAQAVALDPGNPVLRVEFGGLLYQIGQTTKKPADQPILYSRAQNEFQTAIQLKPDYPNAYYNLSKLLETVKDYQNAVLSLQKAISLLGPSSSDLTRATTELTALQAKLPPSPSPTPSSLSQEPSSTISEPSPLPSPLSGGPIDLP